MFAFAQHSHWLCNISRSFGNNTGSGRSTMQDILGMIGSLNRPRLLVQAARFGVDAYARDITLPRLLKSLTLPRSGEAIMRLLDIEAELDDARKRRTSDYTVACHVEVLIALMGEARMLRAQVRSALP